MNGELRLIVAGCVAVVLALIVLVRNTDDVDLSLLAAIGLVGGIAIIANAIINLRHEQPSRRPHSRTLEMMPDEEVPSPPESDDDGSA